MQAEIHATGFIQCKSWLCSLVLATNFTAEIALLQDFSFQDFFF